MICVGAGISHVDKNTPPPAKHKIKITNISLEKFFMIFRAKPLLLDDLMMGNMSRYVRDTDKLCHLFGTH